MPLYFITGNTHKFAEVKSIIPDIEQLDIDLPEIQDIDAKEIIKAKLLEAMRHKQAELIVEDTSLYLDCLNGLPGPFIKWFVKSLGTAGIQRMVAKLENSKAQAKTIIGYAKSTEEIEYFEGAISGTIVESRAESAFGWDPIFLPDGHDKTFAEMSREEKNGISMRRIAVNKLKEYLNNNK